MPSKNTVPASSPASPSRGLPSHTGRTWQLKGPFGSVPSKRQSRALDFTDFGSRSKIKLLCAFSELQAVPPPPPQQCTPRHLSTMFLSPICLIDAFPHHPSYVGTRHCSSWNFWKYRQSDEIGVLPTFLCKLGYLELEMSWFFLPQAEETNPRYSQKNYLKPNCHVYLLDNPRQTANSLPA